MCFAATCRYCQAEQARWLLSSSETGFIQGMPGLPNLVITLVRQHLLIRHKPFPQGCQSNVGLPMDGFRRIAMLLSIEEVGIDQR